MFRVGPALLLNDCASLDTLGFVTGRDATRQAMSRCGMVAVAAGKAFGIVHYISLKIGLIHEICVTLRQCGWR